MLCWFIAVVSCGCVFMQWVGGRWAVGFHVVYLDGFVMQWVVVVCWWVGGAGELNGQRLDSRSWILDSGSCTLDPEAATEVLCVRGYDVQVCICVGE